MILKPVGYQQLTSLATATALTVPAGASRALVQAEAQALRWRDDGTNPTTAVGMNLAVGATLDYRGDLSALKLIEVTAGGIANVTYFA